MGQSKSHADLFFQACFSDSTIIKMLIQRHIAAGTSDQDLEIDQIKLKVLFNYLYEAFIHSGSNLLELYTDLLFVEPGVEPNHPNKESNKNVKMTHQGIQTVFHGLLKMVM